MPADGIVERQIKLAVKSAMIEGGISAGVYAGTIAATIGSLGGASPIAVPAGVATFMVDLTYITQLQLRLAHDIAVIYRVPLDVEDPEDMMKLVRVAFGIKAGEIARGGLVKFAPGLVRQVLKKYYSERSSPPREASRSSGSTSCNAMSSSSPSPTSGSPSPSS
ncbi:hypothetical protein ACWEFJ_16895 [Actinosynnema sp. NPDC004786]